MISFKWRHFKQDIILMLVRWYVAYSLSYRDIEELALERGLKVDHSTINRWVIFYSPQLEAAFRKRHKRPVGLSWRMDETYIKVRGKWVYLYRAVDKEGKTVDFICHSAPEFLISSFPPPLSIFEADSRERESITAFEYY